MESLAVGDRVRSHGWAWKNEPDRIGTVTELYRGQASALDKGLELIAVRWDDTGQVERGYILSSGSLTKLPADAPIDSK